MSLVSQAFNEFARRKRRGFGAGSARTYTVGASEIGMCERRTGYLKHFKPPDEGYTDGWGAMQRGVTFEQAFFVPAMRKYYGDHFIMSGGKQERLVLGELSATPDALLIDQPRDALAHLGVPDLGPSGCVPLECKTVDPRLNLSRPRVENEFQLQVQLGLLRRLTQYKPDYGVLVYTNASFFDDVIEFALPYDDATFREAQKRAVRIMQATKAEQLQPEGWIAGGSECTYCPWSKSCRAIRGDVPDQVEALPQDQMDPEFLEHIINLAIEERARDIAVKETQADHRTAQENIKAALREKGLRMVKTSVINVVWSTMVGRPSYDMPKLKAAATAAGVDVQAYERVGEPSDRLSVTVKNLS
jgi:hypothetical protein